MVMTEEANETCRRFLDSKEAYIDPRGGLRASSSTHIAELVARSMTGNPVD